MSTTGLSRRPVLGLSMISFMLGARGLPPLACLKRMRKLSQWPPRRLGSATLRRTLPEVVANDVELLGSCSMISRRESARVDACRLCRRVLALLACACLSFERYMRACRQFAISIVAYGWIARATPLPFCVQLWSCVHVGSRRIRSASVWLRAALFGGSMHLDVLFATQLVGIMSRLRSRRALTWSTRSGSPAHALHAWLLSWGWTRTSDWKWTHDMTRHSLDLTVAGKPGARQHIVRMPGGFGACNVTCLRRVGMLIWIFLMSMGTFTGLTGKLPGSLPHRALRLGRSAPVLAFRPRRLGVV
jgi:hypothetical protein